MERLQALGRRLVWTVVSLVAFLTALHVVFYLMPGDPVRALFGLRSPGPELIAELRSVFHLDEPYPVQLWRYLSGLVTGDLGPVYRLSPSGLSATSTSVSELIWGSMPSTLRLVGLAILLQAVIGTGLAVAMAEVSGRRLLALKSLISLMIAVPSFLLASLLAIYAPNVVDAANLLAGAACLTALPSGMMALIGYPMLQESRRTRYVLRATASGLPTQRVRWLHALRPSLGTMLVLAAAETGNLLTGAVLVEPILGRQGIGTILTTSIQTRQGPTLLAVVGVAFALVAVLNLLGDAATMALDPRIEAL